MEEMKKEEKKEVQGTITPQQVHHKVSEEEFFNVLKIVAPGTPLRNALDGILKIGKGAIIAIENEQLTPLMDGGFRVNCRFTAQRVMELSKMDGAIVLSKDMKRISYANIMLMPDSKIKTFETGTRHKAAERVAKHIGTLTIAISERKHEINLFYKNIKYTLKNTDEVLRKAHAHIQILEKQRELFDNHVEKLTSMELKNYPSLKQALHVIQKGRLIQKISEDIKKYVLELGIEGTLLKTRMRELTNSVEKEINLVIKDYTKMEAKKSKEMIDSLSYEEILDTDKILKALYYETMIQIEPIKGWRVLAKTGLQETDVAQLIKQAGTLGRAINANIQSYIEILGEEKAQSFKEEIHRIKLNTY